MSTASSPPRTLDLSVGLDAFFEELVAEALEESPSPATEAASCYLVSLLRDFAHPARSAAEPLNGSLTLLLAEALDSAGGERFDRLKSLGDGVLYVRGFFPDHLETRGVTLGYVDALGARAYDSAASMLRRRHAANAGAEVFEELARHFDSFAEVLARISERLNANSALKSDAGVVKVYERWLKTGSKGLAAALTVQGIVPVRGNGGVN